MDELRGRNVLVLGLGVNQGGAGVTRYLVAQGANVRVTDTQTEERLGESLAALDGLPIRYTLGKHDPADFAWADVVVRNPGVPRESSWLQMARDNGARIEMEMTLFFRACPAPIIGVTGTKGKTTTASMIAALLRQRWPGATLAGNMGRSAVMELGSLEPDVPVVIELSSFQIEGLAEQGLAPHVAVFTNLSEDHLDRYPSFVDYARTKVALARHQLPDDWLIYNRDDRQLAAMLAGMPGQAATFGVRDDGASESFWIEDGHFRGRHSGELLDFGPVERLAIPGEHARLNALAAIAAATLAGVPGELTRQGIAAIAPVADRMEPIATVQDVEYVNDTTATVPVAAIAALRAFVGRPLVVLAGGSEKHIPLEGFAGELAERAEAVVLIDGTATPGLQQALADTGFERVHGPYRSMAEAVEKAAAIAEPGSVVLLSPGCASFGMFRNEFDRGRQFREAVLALTDQETGEAR